MELDQPYSVTVRLESGVAPCSRSSCHLFPGKMKKGDILTPAALPSAMIVIFLPLDKVIATGCEPFGQTTFEGLCSI